MLDFYSTWLAMRENGIDDTAAVQAFLLLSERSVADLVSGNEKVLDVAFNLLDQIPIEHFFEVIKLLPIPRALKPADVPCFSSFENGASRLNELLEFEPDGLNYNDAGFQLMNSISLGGRIKYGENHSKLAAMMSLVSISDKRPAIVTATAWGAYLTKFNMKRKESVLKKLLMRDLCIQTILKQALNGPANYREAVSALSDSTALRRRTNVLCLIEFILKGTECEDVLARIYWEM